MASLRGAASGWLHMKKLVLVVVIICASVLISTIGFDCFLNTKRDPALIRLLHGDEKLEIAEIAFDGQQQHLDLRDLESVKYLSAAMRQWSGNKTEYGTSYYGIITFTNGETAQVGILLPVKLNVLTVSYQASFWDDAAYYSIELKEPIPRELSRALTLLRK
jgi:hypothetical protein